MKLTSFLMVVVLVHSVFTNNLSADQVFANSYDMINGGTGSFTYFDDSYNGTGDNTTPYAPLSGGIGDLTNGIIGTANWNVSPGPYVGWEGRDVNILFNFDAVQVFQTVSISFDDSGGFGGVLPPLSVDINGVNFLVSDPAGTNPFTQVFDVSGLAATNTISLDIFRQTSGQWMMVSEVQFDAVPIPEPNSVLLVCAGTLVGLGVGDGLFRPSSQRTWPPANALPAPGNAGLSPMTLPGLSLFPMTFLYQSL